LVRPLHRRFVHQGPYQAPQGRTIPLPERRPVARAERRLDYVLPDPPAPGRTLHEPAAPWLPNEPENGGDLHEFGGMR
jgi:hypothetical protein